MTATATSLALLAANSAQAATVQFTDLASFTANTTGLTTIDFTGTSPSIGITGYLSGLTTTGVNFQSITPGGFLYAANPAFGSINFGSGEYLGTFGVGVITASLPAGTTAVGGDFMGSSGSPFVISLSTGQTYSINSFIQPRQFTGFTSDTPIASISFRNTSSDTFIDNFTFGTAKANTAVPEPFTLVGTLVGSAAAFRMKKRLKVTNKL